MLHHRFVFRQSESVVLLLRSDCLGSSDSWDSQRRNSIGSKKLMKIEIELKSIFETRTKQEYNQGNTDDSYTSTDDQPPQSVATPQT